MAHWVGPRSTAPALQEPARPARPAGVARPRPGSLMCPQPFRGAVPAALMCGRPAR